MGATGLGLGLFWRQDHLKVTDCQVLLPWSERVSVHQNMVFCVSPWSLQHGKMYYILFFSGIVVSMGSEISLHRVYGARRSKEHKNSFLW
ncbi:hypothetical protein H8958_019256 [Nasalis larvatus]